jgi:DNA-binding response OmpR family regulator
MLFMSGYTDEMLARYGLDQGPVDVLTKPYRPAAMLARVQRTLGAGAQLETMKPAPEESMRTIPLIEDDRVLRRAATAAPRLRGFSVVGAENGQEGLRWARTIRPDLVLLDIVMPGLSGVDVLRALRSDDATRGLAVMMLSSSTREEDAAALRALGIVEYLVKADVSLRDLVDTIIRILDTLRPAGTSRSGERTQKELLPP